MAAAAVVPRAAAQRCWRERWKDDRRKARPCDAQAEITRRVPALPRRVTDWRRGGAARPLAMDAVSRQDRAADPVISLLYRGDALPVARRAASAQERGT
jgi:hypothetical protein